MKRKLFLRRPARHALSLLLASVSLASGASAQGPLTVVSWNVESGAAAPATIAARIRDFDGVDLWGLSEVLNDADARTYETAAEDGEGSDFTRVVSASGGSDRLVILFDAGRFELVSRTELPQINIGGNVRATLVAHLRERAGGQEFLFAVNHLYRSRADRRHQQSRLLNDWARTQSLPIVAVGDYNYDWNANNGDQDHDQGFDLLTAGDVFRWVRPATLVRTQCSFNSVLDFVFVANAAKTWPGSSTIVARPNDCPDNAQTSDHRPVAATFQSLGPVVPPPPPPPGVSRAALLQRIEAIERELRELRRLVEQMPQ